MKRPAITVTVFFLLAISLATQVCTADAPPENPYSGDIWSRSTLTGDWGGLRNYLAKKGVTFDINMTNYPGSLYTLTYDPQQDQL